MERIDAAGLACPQPVLLTLEKIKSASDTFEVTVSTQAAVENVTRAAESKSWKADVQRDGELFILTISK